MKHVIIFNNGQSYEDSCETPVCIAPNGNAAKREATRLNEWLKGMWERFPITEGGTVDQDTWLAAEDRRREQINRLRLPYGNMAIREGVQYCCGHFFITAVPDVKAIIP